MMKDQIHSDDNSGDIEFADPTYDGTFKMLFCNEKHKDILIHFLNCLLGFVGTNLITDLIITNTNLKQQNTIYVRCKTQIQSTSLEMQRKIEIFLLADAQDYMTNIITTQILEGVSDNDEEFKENYILVFLKENLFTNSNALIGDNDSLYEKTFSPCCEELQFEEMPGNILKWKTYELNRFKNHMKSGKQKRIQSEYSEKEQWLDFLINCSNYKKLPENINNLIAVSYNILNKAKWTDDERLSYDLETAKKDSYEMSRIEEINNAIKDEMEKGKAIGLHEGKAIGKLEGLEEGKAIGKLEAKLEAEIKYIKILTNLSCTKEDIEKELELLTKKRNRQNYGEIFEYIQNSNDDKAEIFKKVKSFYFDSSPDL